MMDALEYFTAMINRLDARWDATFLPSARHTKRAEVDRAHIDGKMTAYSDAIRAVGGQYWDEDDCTND